MTNRADIIVAGHICLDIIPTLAGAAMPQPGGLTKIGAATVTTGGAVANTGLALHRLGAAVRLMGKVGDDIFGRAILGVLNTHDPSLAADMIVTPGEVTSYSLVMSPPGIDRSFLHCTGANDTFDADDIPCEMLSGAKIFHFGYPPVMARMYANDGEQLRTLLCRARDVGLVTSLDMTLPDAASAAGRIDWAKLFKEVLPKTDVFLPSIDELLFIMDRELLTRVANGTARIDGALLRRLGKHLTRIGVAVAVIKLGDLGLYLHTSSDVSRMANFCERLGLDAAAWTGRECYSRCFQAERVAGTTGAGDCTIAGFLSALLRGSAPDQAVKAAAAVGAASVEAADATSGVPAWAVIEARINRGWPQHSESLDWGNAETSQRGQNVG